MLHKIIAKRNLRLMQSLEDGGMKSLLGAESWGGNIGINHGITCGAANFLFYNETGEIIEFTNNPNPGMLHEGTFLVIQNPNLRIERIVKYSVNPYISEKAKLNIERSIELFNLRDCISSLEYTRDN